jgi:hypothetical protein
MRPEAVTPVVCTSIHVPSLRLGSTVPGMSEIAHFSRASQGIDVAYRRAEVNDMPEQKSKQDDPAKRAASPIPQDQDDELEMADDDDADFDEDDEGEDDNETDEEEVTD